MSIQNLQKLIDSFHYWDARATQLNCNYFADEIELIFKDKGVDVIYKFVGCYKSFFNHVKTYDKQRPVKEMTSLQLPYFLQKIEIGEKIEQETHFYICKINMFPLEIEIWCKNIEIDSIKDDNGKIK